MAPKRIQRRRTKGWRMPPNTVSVTRPGRWGNQFVVSTKRRAGTKIGCEYIAVPTVEDAIECYREWLNQNPEIADEARKELAGKNLACFCKIGEPCHADVLLQLVNDEWESAIVQRPLIPDAPRTERSEA